MVTNTILGASFRVWWYSEVASYIHLQQIIGNQPS